MTRALNSLSLGLPTYDEVFFAQGMIPMTILNLLIGEGLAEASAKEGINTYHIIGTVLPKPKSQHSPVFRSLSPTFGFWA